MQSASSLPAHSLPAHIAYTRSLACDIRFNLSHSCGQACSLDELLSLDTGDQIKAFSTQPLEYASVQGAVALRKLIAQFHQEQNLNADQQLTLTSEHVVTFAGAQEALMAIYQSLIRPEDEVIVFTPNYPSLTSMVAPLGGKLVPIPMEFNAAEGRWQFNMQALAEAVNARTRLIVINAPHNPTGGCLSHTERQQVLALAKQFNCYLLADDVTQPITNEGSIAHDYLHYERAISISVMSKSFGLGGVRIGWAITQNLALIEQLIACKASQSICTSSIDEQLAVLALTHRKLLVSNTQRIAKRNLQRFTLFADKHKDKLSWQAPAGGLLSLVKVHTQKPMRNWCQEVTRTSGILVLPSELFGLSGPYFRLGVGQQNFSEALEAFEVALSNNC